MRIVLIVTVVLVMSLVSCKEKKDEENSINANIASTMESAIDAVNDEMDDIGQIALARNKIFHERVYDFFIPNVYAAGTCSGFALLETCTENGDDDYREKVYEDCKIALTAIYLDGSVRLSYTANNCAYSINDSITRTYNLSFTRNLGGTFYVSSESHTNYLDDTIGGGATIEKIDTNKYEVSLNGKHRWATYNGITIINHSLHTDSPVTVTDDTILTRFDRVVDGGSLKIDHNIAKYTTTIVPSAVTWGSSGCCYPTSGSFAVSFSGSISGSGTLTFATTCGKATWEKRWSYN